MHTAPVRPREPPITSTSPEPNFVEFVGAPRRPLAARSSRITPPAGCAGSAVGDADGGDAQLARPPLARRDPVTELRRVEGHRDVARSTEAPSTSPVEALDPRGDVGGDDRRAATVDRLDRGVGGRAGRPSKPVPKIASMTAPDAGERLDRLRRRPRADLAVEALEVRGRVRRELAGRPEQQHLDLVAGRRQVPRRHEAVAARCCPCRRPPGPGPSRARRAPPRPPPRPPSPSAPATGRPARRSPRSPPPACPAASKRGSSQLSMPAQPR